MAFVSDVNPRRRYLIDPQLLWHSSGHYWGTGHVVTSLGSFRWCAPEKKIMKRDAQTLTFALDDAGLELEVERCGGADRLAERYTWRNVSGQRLVIRDLGVQTPFNDCYPSRGRALRESVNAHVFAGGAWSWVMAEPMNGSGADHDPILGLIVREGAVNAYSIESRDENTYSNIRGHIVLQVTDRARNAEAFGGQPELALEPDESYTLAWELGWYGSRKEFLEDTNPRAEFSTMCATVGDAITVRSDDPIIVDDSAVQVDSIADKAADGESVILTATKPGVYRVRIGSSADASTTEVLFHRSLRDQARERASYLLRYQRAKGRPGSLAYAFVPVDTRTGLRTEASGWADWGDGSERDAMAIFLQKAVNAGWFADNETSTANGSELPIPSTQEAQQAVDEWAQFAKEHLLDENASTRRDSAYPDDTFGDRIYDLPWMAEFFLDHYQASGDLGDLDLAARILERISELGGQRFLAISYAEVSERAVRELVAAGQESEANRLRQHVIDSANYFTALGTDLPDHEVAYEQSMVAPLVNLLISAYRFTSEEKYLSAIEERLHWLLSFSGPQPDSRLQDIAIRHWDGYWFGIRRQYGDVFPHYWSALTATVLARLPEPLRSTETDRMALNIMRANMANYGEDGSATCAFVFPSSVDGRPAHQADPLANDQDWHLAIWLRLIADEHFPEV
ncbi:hypothetical protein BLI708_02395 [Bifidobacterium imperatoris]|uniref:Six-hairpin glycosidase n=1 Tax=Bifidobacterium imperatoris TaxID=2020965 RepID=A0ABX7S4X8_9BIFI|nr:hypothetical protein BLI708_02395 [Bifidobacterium imperatoris]